MITKEIFIKMLNKIEEFIAETERWEAFGLSIFEQPIQTIPWEIIDIWIDTHFTADGNEWIYWYLFERKSIITGEILPCYDENDQIFYVKDVSDLWDLVKDYIISEDEKVCPITKEPCTNS